MPHAVRLALITLSALFVAVGGYYRIQSQRSGERLDRTKEGWPILIGIRLVGLLTLASTVYWLWSPTSFKWASWPVAEWLRWMGVIGFGFSVTWLSWMFHALGKNLTDTVVTRRDAYLVMEGPYRFVRNPMYCGTAMAGWSVGVAMGTWLPPLGASVVFALMVVRTRKEEKYLLARFGDRYRDYMKRVGRFVPQWRAATK
jgi:protein-S-isoprenylcysteine O-methyltransferase Ste14